MRTPSAGAEPTSLEIDISTDEEICPPKLIYLGRLWGPLIHPLEQRGVFVRRDAIGGCNAGAASLCKISAALQV